ncbi:MAG TPA: hypothetical protein VN428_19690 [Bryobacteraceae bacterium]|nr:hypothetical protein [Bryobacteraceae bacterium]
MANSEKHKRNPIQDWLGEDEIPAQAKARGAASGKLPKSGSRRRTAAADEPAKPDPMLMREPSQMPRTDVKTSQASSPDHLRKQQRLADLRAPHSTKPGRAAGTGR